MPEMNAEAFPQKYLPQVIFDKSIQDPDIPYTVSFDLELYAKLLKEYGMQDSDIASIKITFRRKSGIVAFPAESYVSRFKPREIVMSLDSVWSTYQACSDLAQNIIEGKIKGKTNSFEYFLKTKRLTPYLRQAPTERANRFVKEIMEKAKERESNRRVLHESRHVLDSKDKLKNVISYLLYPVVAGGTGIVAPELFLRVMDAINLIPSSAFSEMRNTMPYVMIAVASFMQAYLLVYQIDPMERSARKFEKLLNSNPEYRKLLILRPRDNNELPTISS